MRSRVRTRLQELMSASTRSLSECQLRESAPGAGVQQPSRRKVPSNAPRTARSESRWRSFMGRNIADANRLATETLQKMAGRRGESANRRAGELTLVADSPTPGFRVLP